MCNGRFHTVEHLEEFQATRSDSSILAFSLVSNHLFRPGWDRLHSSRHFSANILFVSSRVNGSSYLTLQGSVKVQDYWPACAKKKGGKTGR